MTVRLQDIDVGRCYVTASEQVRLVLELTPDGQVCWKDLGRPSVAQKTEFTMLQRFAREVDCEVTCDYEPSYWKRMA